MNSTKFAFISPKVLNIYQRTFSLGIAKTFGLWHWGGGGGGVGPGIIAVTKVS